MSKAAATRQTILQKAFELIYAQGYQATSIDDILATTAVTKGAFYYHFKSKDDMGVAIIDEVLRPTLTSSFTTALQATKNPLDAIYGLMHGLLLENDFLKVEHGCPAANLAQEMTPWNAEFRKVLDELTQACMDAMDAVIEQGKAAGYIRADVGARQVTFFVFSGYWGIRSFGKLGNSPGVYLPYLKELKRYLQSLR